MYVFQTSACLQCIKKGPEAVSSCLVEDQGACCTTCAADPLITPENPCTYMRCVVTTCDMGGGQPKAMRLLNEEHMGHEVSMVFYVTLVGNLLVILHSLHLI